MSRISPKLIDVENNRVEYISDTDKQSRKTTYDKQNKFVYGYGNKLFGDTNDVMFDDKLKYTTEFREGGRFPTQLFTNIKNEQYKYVKYIT